MNQMVVAVFRMTDTGELDHLIGFTVTSFDHVGIGDDSLVLQTFADIVRLDEA